MDTRRKTNDIIIIALYLVFFAIAVAIFIAHPEWSFDVRVLVLMAPIPAMMLVSVLFPGLGRN